MIITKSKDKSNCNNLELCWQQSIRWMGASVLAFPVGVLLHELAHYITAVAFGFEGARLSYMTAPYDLEELVYAHIANGDLSGLSNVYPLWQLAINSAAGPMATYIIALTCILLSIKRINPFIISLGITVNMRALALLFIGLTQPQSCCNDENVFGKILGIPPIFFMILAVVLFFVTAFWLIKRIPKGQRIVASSSIIMGTIIGATTYMSIGAWLFP